MKTSQNSQVNRSKTESLEEYFRRKTTNKSFDVEKTEFRW